MTVGLARWGRTVGRGRRLRIGAPSCSDYRAQEFAKDVTSFPIASPSPEVHFVGLLTREASLEQHRPRERSTRCLGMKKVECSPNNPPILFLHNSFSRNELTPVYARVKQWWAVLATA